MSYPVTSSPYFLCILSLCWPPACEKSVKLNNCPVMQTPGGPCIWLWKPLLGWTVCFHSGQDSCVSSSRPLRATVKWSKPLQPLRQAEQPCGKRAVFATDFHCFTTGLHSNLCAWPSHDLQSFYSARLFNPFISYIFCHFMNKTNRQSNLFVKYNAQPHNATVSFPHLERTFPLNPNGHVNT